MIVEHAVAQEVDVMATGALDDDASIVGRMARGDRQALAEFYARYRLSLYRYLLQLTPDHGLAEELLQDTLVAAWKSSPTFAGRARVQTWLFGIARRQAHNTLRRRGLPLADVTALAELPVSDPDPEATALARASHAELTMAFNRLSPVHREVLLLAFVEELSYQESAEVLCVPVGTVKSRLSNAKQALRAILSAREEPVE
jgi:RNA polymerase sigma-70 factor (ECF subfamily)